MLRALVVAACTLASPASAEDASEWFAMGERAFAAADYGEALQLFTAARDAGSSGPGTLYNIGVCQYVLRDYDAAEATFAELADEFPAMRELADYNRGLALRARGDAADARAAFARARSSADEKIAALANAQLAELGGARADDGRWRGYFSGAAGHDDNVALVDELVLASGESSSSPLAEAIGVVSRDLGAVPLRFDASGYLVRYLDADEFDQAAIRLALATDRDFGRWTIAAGPTLGRSTLGGDEFEETIGADLRLRRAFDSGLALEARVVYDDVDAGDARFAYLEGSRRQLRVAVQHSRNARRVRVGYDAERADRADPGVSAERQRWSVGYRRRLSGVWSAEAVFYRRTSRYDEASVPREERLLELSLALRRDLRSGWTVNTDYRWSDNDSNVSVFSYESQRAAVGLSRSF